MFRLDEQLFRQIHTGWNGALLDPIFFFFSYVGLGQVQALFALGFLMKRDLKHFALPLLVSILLSGVAAQIVKRIVPRDRPSSLLYSAPQEEWLSNSFPSGHTTSAFGFAAMLFFLTFGTRRAWIGWLAMACAILVGLSRVYRGVHWPSDALAGMFIGCFAAAIAYLLLDWRGIALSPPEGSVKST